MISSNNRIERDNIQIACEHDRNDCGYDCNARISLVNKTRNDIIDYETSLEYKGLMTRYDNMTWKMYDRIMSYRYYKGLHNDCEEDSKDDQVIDHQSNQEPVTDTKILHEWQNKKQCPINDGYHSYHDGKICIANELQTLTQEDLMKNMMLCKTGKIASKICVKANHCFHDQYYYSKTSSNTMMNPTIHGSNSYHSSSILQAPSNDLSTNENSHKGIIIPTDNNEGMLSKKMILATIHMTASSVYDSTNVYFDRDHGHMMILKAPQIPVLSSNPTTSGYVPNDHQAFQQSNELDPIFELDL